MLILPYSPFQKNEHWELDIIAYWVIGAGCWMENGLELSPSPPYRSKDFNIALVYIYQLTKFGG